jgi:hypothetical protein
MTLCLCGVVDAHVFNDLANDGRLYTRNRNEIACTHNGLRQQIRIFEQLRQRRSSRLAACYMLTLNYDD